MDPATIATIIAGVITTAVKLGPGIIADIEAAMPFANEIVALIKGDNVSEADLTTLENRSSAIAAALAAAAAADAATPPSA